LRATDAGEGTSMAEFESHPERQQNRQEAS